MSEREIVEADPSTYIARMLAKMDALDKAAFNFCVRQGRAAPTQGATPALCPTCHGNGSVSLREGAGHIIGTAVCPTCRGRGEAAAPPTGPAGEDVAEELGRAIGDLGPARRHVARITSGVLQASNPAVQREIDAAIERCVRRLQALRARGRTGG